MQWSSHAPACAGDALGAVISVLSVRETRKPDLGIVDLRFEIHNEHEVLAQRAVSDHVPSPRGGRMMGALQ